MKQKWLKTGLVVSALGIATPALAVDATSVANMDSTDMERPEASLEVLGGVMGFTGELGNQTGLGPGWGLKANTQPRSFLGVELGYEGSRIPISDVRVGNSEGIWRHNATALAKVGPLVRDFQPFVGTGFGVSYLNPSNGADAVYNTDFQGEFPVAAGIDFRKGKLIAGARATYSWLLGDNLTTVPGTGRTAEGGLLNVGLNVGGQF